MLLFKATYNALKVYMLLVDAFSKNRTHDASVASTCSTVLSVRNWSPGREKSEVLSSVSGVSEE